MACVRKRRVGKGYRWVLDYRDQQGRRHWETTKGNRKEAEGLLAERAREIGRGTYRAPAERVIFDNAAAAYLKHTEASVRTATIKDYKCNLTLHLLPYFQGWKLRDIRRADVEALRARLLDGGTGRRTVNKSLSLLVSMFRYAMRHEWCDANPAEDTKLRASSRRSHDCIEGASCPLPRSEGSGGLWCALAANRHDGHADRLEGGRAARARVGGHRLAVPASPRPPAIYGGAILGPQDRCIEAAR